MHLHERGGGLQLVQQGEMIGNLQIVSDSLSLLDLSPLKTSQESKT